MRKPRQNGFTLVEMLTVLVIIGVLAVITLSGMHNIGRSQALHNASRQIADQINKARNYALVNGSYVYMVIPTAQTTTDPTYPFQTFGFCVSVASNSSNPFSNVQYVEPIQYLPVGIVFSNFTVNTSLQYVAFPKGGPPGNNGTSWVITFTSSGQIVPLVQTPRLFVHRGTYDPVSQKPIRTEVNYDEIDINTLIGKPIITSF